MNILIVAIGSDGDVNPFIQIGTALQNRGHKITFLTNSYFKDAVKTAGLDFKSVGSSEAYHRMLDEVDVTNPTKTTKAVMRYLYFPSIQKTYDAIAQLLIPGQTLVVAITMAFGARMVREKFNIPVITCHLAPVSFPSVLHPAKMDNVWMPHWMPGIYKQTLWRFIDKASDIFLGPPINNMLKRLELPPVKRIMRNWIHSPDKVIGLFPGWFATPQPDWPENTELTHFICADNGGMHPMPPELEEFVGHDEPFVVFTAGTAVKNATAFFAESAKACDALNIRGVFLSQYRDHIPEPLPDHLLYCTYAPFSQLLPMSSALVHHGGIGSCAQALLAGVPQLLAPFGMDQHDNAARLVNLGVGDVISMKKYKSAVVVKKLGKLLEAPEVQKNSKNMADAMKNSDPLFQLCRIIEAQADHQNSMENRS